MDEGKGSLEALLRRRHLRNVMTAGLAVALSLLVHLLLLERFPPLSIGKVSDETLADRLKPVELGDVELQALPATERPTVFRPEDPERMTDLAREAEEFAEALKETLPPEPDIESKALRGEEAPVEEVEAPEARDAWEPRQEILQIEEPLFSEEVTAIPRKFVAGVPRTQGAPDITMPVELGHAELVAALEATVAHGEVDLAPGLGIEDLFPPEEHDVVSSEQATAESRRDTSVLMDEAPEDVTDIQPVEQLLALDLAAYRPEDENGVYFKLEIKRAGAEALPVLPRDILLIQDCSESMTQRKLNECKKGLHQWMDRLGPGDRFNVMGFRNRPYTCFEGWSPVTAAARARARWFVEEMISRGKTDVYASLQGVLETEVDPGRAAISVLITDGRPTTGIVDSSDIIEGFTQANQGRHSVFTVGGGRRVNRYLLDLLSYRNRGDSLIVRDRREIPSALDQWAVALGRPVLVGLRYRFSGLDEVEVYPRTLTHLYLDRPLVIYGRCPAGYSEVAFQIVGQSGEVLHDMVFTVDWAKASAGDDAIRTEWVWHRIYDLIGEHIRTRRPEVLEEIHALARRHGLRVPYERRLRAR